MEIPDAEAAAGLSEIFGVQEADLNAVFATSSMIRINATHFNLYDLFAAGDSLPEHDGSLLRADRYVVISRMLHTFLSHMLPYLTTSQIYRYFEGNSTFSEELWRQMVGSAADECFITRDELMQFRRLRILDSRNNNPGAYFGMGPGPDIPFIVRLAFDTGFHLVVSGDIGLERAYFSDLRPVVEDGRLPMYYVPRQLRGEPLLSVMAPPVTDVIGGYIPQIIGAIYEPLN